MHLPIAPKFQFFLIHTRGSNCLQLNLRLSSVRELPCMPSCSFVQNVFQIPKKILLAELLETRIVLFVVSISPVRGKFSFLSLFFSSRSFKILRLFPRGDRLVTRARLLVHSD